MPRVLLVDGNLDFRRALSLALTSQQPRIVVVEASGVYEALLRAPGCQLAFVDIRLPDGNGLVLTQQLKGTFPRLRICVMTQFGLPEYRTAALRSGADALVRKEELDAAMLSRLLGSVMAEVP